MPINEPFKFMNISTNDNFLLSSCQIESNTSNSLKSNSNTAIAGTDKPDSSPIKIFSPNHDNNFTFDTTPNEKKSSKKRNNSLDLLNTSVKSLKFTHYLPLNNAPSKKVNNYYVFRLRELVQQKNREIKEKYYL